MNGFTDLIMGRHGSRENRAIKVLVGRKFLLCGCGLGRRMCLILEVCDIRRKNEIKAFV
jgi:hypothetical protein